jgi:hypothetical protein
MMIFCCESAWWGCTRASGKAAFDVLCVMCDVLCATCEVCGVPVGGEQEEESGKASAEAGGSDHMMNESVNNSLNIC